MMNTAAHKNGCEDVARILLVAMGSMHAAGELASDTCHRWPADLCFYSHLPRLSFGAAHTAFWEKVVFCGEPMNIEADQ